MTDFLPAGIINDIIEDIYKRVIDLNELMENDQVSSVISGLRELEVITGNMSDFINSLECQPLIYTGAGSTEEIIKRLEWALVFSEEIDQDIMLKCKKEMERKRLKGK